MSSTGELTAFGGSGGYVHLWAGECSQDCSSSKSRHSEAAEGHPARCCQVSSTENGCLQQDMHHSCRWLNSPSYLLAGNGANVRVNAFAQHVELPEPKSAPLQVKEEASFAIPMPFMAEQVGSTARLSLQVCDGYMHS